MFSKDLGIDLGTMFTRIADGTQVLLEEPTIVAIEVEDQKMVAVGQEALSFLIRRRAELFTSVPIVHTGVDRAAIESLSLLPRDVVGVPADLSFTRTFETALRWHPGARRLVIVTGASNRDRELEAQARKESAAFSDRVRLEFLAGAPLPPPASFSSQACSLPHG